MKKPGIPGVPSVDPALYGLLLSLKETSEILTGVRGGQLTSLPSTASLSDVIVKVNQIVARLNQSGV